jgi:hypothetical protein
MQISLAEARLRSSVHLEADRVRSQSDKLPTQIYGSIVYLPANPDDPPVAPSASSASRSSRPPVASTIEY